MTLTSEPAKAIDPHALRADFPILRTKVHGKPLVYLDSASTSQKPQVVIDAVDEFYREYNANVHRGIYEIGERSTAAYEKARAQIARFIGAPDAHEVIFTRNATEAINLVAYSWGRKSIGRGDVIVLTEMEHHANLVPWQLLVQEKDGDLEFIPITDDGVLRLDVFEVLLKLKPKLVAFTHVSNTLGTINPVEELTRMAHDAGALVLIDGAQAVPARAGGRRGDRGRLLRVLRPQDARPARLGRPVGAPRAARVDAAVPGGRRDDPRGPSPPRPSGTTSRGSSRRARRTWPRPSAWVPPRTTFAASAWTRSASTSASSSGTRSRRCAREVPGIELYGPPADQRGGVVPFNLPGIHPHDVAQVLDRFGIAVRAGHHCTMPLHERLDLAATARASFNVYSTREDIDALANGLKEVQRVFDV